MRIPALFLLALLLPAMSSAQYDWYANLNVVLTEPDYTGWETSILPKLEAMKCEDLVSAPIDGPAFLWVIMSDRTMYPDGIGGIQFGVRHQMSIDGWVLCTGGSETPEVGWPASGTGNAVGWAGDCYAPPGENAVVGFFLLSDGASGALMLTADARVGEALWYNCIPITEMFYPEFLGGLDTSTSGNPNCHPTPTAKSSWGRIKAHY